MIFSLGKNRNRRSVLDMDELPYVKKARLFSREERLLLSILKRVFKHDARVLAKVQISHVVEVDSDLDKASQQSAYDKISTNCFDFLLCHPNNYSVFCAVELEKNTPFNIRGRKNANLLDEICLAADLPLVRIEAKTEYEEDEIRSLIGPLIESPKKRRRAVKQQPTKISTVENGKSCPLCSDKIVKRRVKKGKNTGVKFWACSNYPQCRHIEAVIE